MKQSTTYYQVKSCTARIQVHQGGTRSGKTYSICQALIEWCYLNQGCGWIISIIRKTFPALRGSVMRDFINILISQDWYDERDHNKSESMYTLFGNLIEFVSVDQPQKIRGRKRNICFINECNELHYEDWRQLILRTTDKIILDFNPSDEFHWLHDSVIPRDDAEFFQTTYLDNPFLDQSTVDEIERLRDTDDNYWRIYGLGERGVSKETVFQFKTYDEIPEAANLVAYGLDWGYANDPTALVSVHKHGDELYLDQHIYSGGLTNSDIIEKLTELGVGRAEIIADSAEPKSIEDLHRARFHIKPSKKGPDSIRAGVDVMRRKKLFIQEGALDMLKEFRNYKWATDKNGRALNKPVDEWNHAIDAVRYVCLNKLRKKSGKYFIS